MAAISQAERQRRDTLYELGLKQCNTCTEPLPLVSFAPRHDGYRGLNGTCRGCKSAQAAEHRKRTPDHQAYRQRRWQHANREAWLAISRRRDARVRWRKEGVAI
jgi:hypothetical protein